MKNNPEFTAPAQQFPFARAIAYFRSSLHDGQKKSISIQQDQARLWAHEHGIEIIHEFSDLGPSWTDNHDCPGLNEMVESGSSHGLILDTYSASTPAAWSGAWTTTQPSQFWKSTISTGDLHRDGRSVCPLRAKLASAPVDYDVGWCRDRVISKPVSNKESNLVR